MTHSAEWYTVQNMEDIDTPALLVYPARVHDNIRQMIRIVGDLEKLRPHVKTYKMAEIVKMQMNEGIHKFKCATIAEAEMLALVGVTDTLLAYQPVGPKIQRLLKLVQHYPKIKFSTLVDNEDTARSISQVFQAEGKVLHIYIDLDIGNNRTGIPPENALQLYKLSQTLGGIKVAGLHAYDGHIRESDLSVRKKICDVCFEGVKQLQKNILVLDGQHLEIIAGGSPTFPIHAQRQNVVCSPGTCLLWDWGIGQRFQDMNFSWAALVATRIISLVGNDKICLDLGHKAIASENPFPRALFLNLPEAEQIFHSEEHLVLKVPDNKCYKVGDLFYGVPFHICPTCALYQEAQIVEEGQITKTWKVVSRDRSITI
ncbi:MAG: D-TA family PLP-dependent enzyme [Bacteroidetes bacterium]|nr:D-TA family PLP-dependent enzyme [Bacteroidota bacterium]